MVIFQDLHTAYYLGIGAPDVLPIRNLTFPSALGYLAPLY
jgi:hypothetical protein